MNGCNWVYRRAKSESRIAIGAAVLAFGGFAAGVALLIATSKFSSVKLEQKSLPHRLEKKLCGRVDDCSAQRIKQALVPPL